MSRNGETLGERPDLEIGSEVLVEEDGLRTWTGTVQAVKPSSVSGWWVDVRRNGDGTWSVPAALVRRNER